jgi:hypothetical protein
MAQTLFDIEPHRQETNRELVITHQHNEKLSKQQMTFNRLVKKIEGLRTNLKETATLLDAQLEYHSKHIYPVEAEVTRLQKDELKLLFSFYKNKRQLSQNQRKSIREVLSDLLGDILSSDRELPDAETQEIFEAIEGMGFDEAANQDFESMKEDMEMMFRSQGVDVDFGEFHKDMTQEDMMRKIHEIKEKAAREHENKNAKKAAGKKTKKQAEKIERERLIEESRNKNIGNIYRQLVKVLHPDLEKDESLRPVKEELMKQLSVAYKNNDLHSLLKLELEWINMEENNTRKLTDEKLSIYNEVLKEQVQELEYEMDMLKHHPRYLPLAPYYNLFMFKQTLDLEREKRNLESVVKTLITSIDNLKGANPLHEIKELIRIHKAQEKDFHFLEFL